jgi:hypothetical protein
MKRHYWLYICAALILMGLGAAFSTAESGSAAARVGNGPSTPTPQPTPCSEADRNYTFDLQIGQTLVPDTEFVGGNCSECTLIIPMPFTYYFYGVPNNQVRVSNKGRLTFAPGDSNPNNQCLPVFVWYAIFPHWDDIVTNIDDTMGIYTRTLGSAPNRIFVVEERAGYLTSDARVTFQVLLYEGQQRFDIIYGTLHQQGHGATVGVQYTYQGPGRLFTQWSCNQFGAIQQGYRLIAQRACPCPCYP